MHVLFLFLCELFSKTKAAFSVLSTSNMHLSQDCTSGRRSVLQQIGATFRGVLKWNGRTWIVWATRLTWFGQIKLHLMYFCYHAMKFTWLLSSGIVSYCFSYIIRGVLTFQAVLSFKWKNPEKTPVFSQNRNSWKG